MSAELLREAASKMRERAEECRPVSWVQNGRNGVHTPIGQCVATTHSHDDAMRKAEAEHIASWHPAVALAVADWLDRCVRLLSDGRSCYGPEVESAVTVARAYVGSDR